MLDSVNHGESQITGIELLKGGRYLFTIASGNQTARIWDLGVAGSEPLEKPLLIASITIKDFEWGAEWELCVRGERIKVAFLNGSKPEYVSSFRSEDRSH